MIVLRVISIIRVVNLVIWIVETIQFLLVENSPIAFKLSEIKSNFGLLNRFNVGPKGFSLHFE